MNPRNWSNEKKTMIGYYAGLGSVAVYMDYDTVEEMKLNEATRCVDLYDA